MIDWFSTISSSKKAFSCSHFLLCYANFRSRNDSAQQHHKIMTKSARTKKSREELGHHHQCLPLQKLRTAKKNQISISHPSNGVIWWEAFVPCFFPPLVFDKHDKSQFHQKHNQRRTHRSFRGPWLWGLLLQGSSRTRKRETSSVSFEVAH